MVNNSKVALTIDNRVKGLLRCYIYLRVGFTFLGYFTRFIQGDSFSVPNLALDDGNEGVGLFVISENTQRNFRGRAPPLFFKYYCFVGINLRSFRNGQSEVQTNFVSATHLSLKRIYMTYV